MDSPQVFSVALADVSFSASCISRHDSKDIACEKDVPPKNRCYIRYLHLFSTKKYKVTLTVTNALGSSSTSTSFDEFAIGK